MNEFGEPNMGNPSVRFDEGRESVGHWPLAFQSILSRLLYNAKLWCRYYFSQFIADKHEFKLALRFLPQDEQALTDRRGRTGRSRNIAEHPKEGTATQLSRWRPEDSLYLTHGHSYMQLL